MHHSTLGLCRAHWITDCSYTGQTLLQKRNINNVNQVYQIYTIQCSNIYNINVSELGRNTAAGEDTELEAESEESEGEQQSQKERETVEETTCERAATERHAGSDGQTGIMETDSHLNPRLTEEEISVEKVGPQETEENEDPSNQPRVEEARSGLPGGGDGETESQQDRTDNCPELKAGSDGEEENSTGLRRWCCHIL